MLCSAPEMGGKLYLRACVSTSAALSRVCLKCPLLLPGLGGMVTMTTQLTPASSMCCDSSGSVPIPRCWKMLLKFVLYMKDASTYFVFEMTAIVHHEMTFLDTCWSGDPLMPPGAELRMCFQCLLPRCVRCLTRFGSVVAVGAVMRSL